MDLNTVKLPKPINFLSIFAIFMVSTLWKRILMIVYFLILLVMLINKIERIYIGKKNEKMFKYLSQLSFCLLTIL